MAPHLFTLLVRMVTLTISLLLKADADPNLGSGATPLMIAALKDHSHIVGQLTIYNTLLV